MFCRIKYIIIKCLIVVYYILKYEIEIPLIEYLSHNVKYVRWFAISATQI